MQAFLLPAKTWRNVYKASKPFRSRCRCQCFATASSASSTTTVEGHSYPVDESTNVPSSILSRIPFKLHEKPSHPLHILRSLIHSAFPSDFQVIAPSSPVVSVYQNFDELGFPPDHPGRAATDSYYLNREHMLRTHTSAHEVDVFKRGAEKWLLSAEVYRRDEIDRSHYPVFHQMEGAYVLPRDQIQETMQAENEQLEKRLQLALAQGRLLIEDDTQSGTEANPWQESHDQKSAEIVARSLKLHLNHLVLSLFGPAQKDQSEPLKIRWLEDAFPFTSPSYQMEVFYDGRWLEIFGSGVVKQYTLDQAGVPHKMGWAFGLGLDRIAMILFGIPDIRLFWSTDERFSTQFTSGKVTTFKPYSKFPPCYKDVSFWLNEEERKWHENDFCDIVRDEAGDLVADVKLVDEFVHPRTKKRSLCYRINYQSMDRNLENKEVDALQDQVIASIAEQMKVTIR